MAEPVDRIHARWALPALTGPVERVAVVGIYRDEQPIARLIDEVLESRHRVDVRLGSMDVAPPRLRDVTAREHLRAGKFQNLNELVAVDDADLDWLLIVDDDVVLPAGFLDRMIEVCRRCDFALAQPAQTRGSNANWRIAKRHFLSLARQTGFVEIGPVTLLRRDALAVLAPFPAHVRYGWGLDFVWAEVMRRHGLLLGIVDALAVEHSSRAVATTYSWDAAQAEGRRFLETVPHAPTSITTEPPRRIFRWAPRRAGR
ncbi:MULTISPECIES: hypothetical protein [Microbacterium]|uniref:hypothetical protein n=1 Tax=Microbacterium TaxID=33882 RepID=UPI00214B3A1A|nr:MULTISPECIES: hypothetical protein [unclassified Microbacterium]MCR2812708.1 hypothetical protein [Microbacterium sp. zg.Y1084]MDL5485860.1 hypothetical protein [Microbacterium sp. zg-Y1211]